MSLKKNVVANFLGQGWSGIMALAFIPVYIKYLGVEAYGLIGVFAAIQAWLVLLDFGMTPTINREMARYTAGSHTAQSIRDLLRSLEVVCMLMAMVMVFAIYFLSGWLATDWLKVETLPIDVVSQTIAIIGLVVALRFIEGLYRGAIIGLQKQVWLNYILSVSATLRWAGAAVVVVWVRVDIKAYFLWHGLVSILTIIMFVAAVHRWLPKPEKKAAFSIDALKSVWAFASGIVLITFLALMLTQIDKVILSKLISLKEFGYYTLATAVVGILYQVILPFTQAYYPKLTEMATNKNDDALKNTYHQAAQLVTVFIVSVSLSLMIYGHHILLLWTGNLSVAEATAPVLAVLALGTMLNGLMHIPYMLQLAHGWTSFAVKANSIAIIFLVPMILWATPHYGVIGAAWCWVLLNMGYMTIGMHYMHKTLLTSEKINWYIQDVSQPILAIATCFFVSYLLYPQDLNSLAQVAWIIGTLGISFFTGLLASSKVKLVLIFETLYLKYKYLKS